MMERDTAKEKADEHARVVKGLSDYDLANLLMKVVWMKLDVNSLGLVLVGEAVNRLRAKPEHGE